MAFVWHDGGRAACGFVGTTGDCVTRSIAIATGEAYRGVYDALSGMSQKTARYGIIPGVIDNYLNRRGWKPTNMFPCGLEDLPVGVVLVEFAPVASGKRSGHLSCVINHTVYDTWNPFEDVDYVVDRIWTSVRAEPDATVPIPVSGSRAGTNESRLTQREYERILNRVKALHRTASNHASTEGEIRNALRAMQSLMLEHNLNRNDIVDDAEVSRVGMTRRACPLNGSRACQWESALAHYLTKDVFPTVQFFQNRHGHRTLFWFYGPVDDVEQSIGLFREMLITIATAARLKYGGFSRGSGASYAEGYVKGLPRQGQLAAEATAANNNAATEAEAAAAALRETDHATARSLMFTRALAVHAAANEWLEIECGIRLTSIRSSGRGSFDPSAHQAGKNDGAKHAYSGIRGQKRISHHSSS